MSSNVDSWRLYVDESGGFELETDRVSVVVGVVLRGEEDPAFNDELRRTLRSFYPLAPWPLHAADLNQPASRIWYALGDAGTPGAAREAALEEVQPALAALRRSDSALAAKFVADASNRQEPKHDLLQGAASEFRRTTPDAYLRVRALAERERTGFRAHLASVVREISADDLFLVAGVARHGAHDAVHDTGKLEPDSYLDALSTTLERTIAVLREDPPRPNTDVKVWARIATRGVGIRGFGRHELNAQHIAEVARGAASLPSLLGRSQPRIIAADFITRFDETAHPGVVLADHLSNAMFGMLGSQVDDRTPWSAFAHEYERVTGMRVTRRAALLGGLTVPTVAAARISREAILASLRGTASPALATEPARWAREQAQTWITAFARARGAS